MLAGLVAEFEALGALCGTCRGVCRWFHTSKRKCHDEPRRPREGWA